MGGQDLPERIGELVFKYLQNSLNKAEKEELESWVRQSTGNLHEFNRLTDLNEVRASVKEYRDNKEKSWADLLAKAPELAPAPVYSFKWWNAVAAALVLLAGAATFYWYHSSPSKSTVREEPIVSAPSGDLSPGTTRATLTLANGQTIVLDSKMTGTTLAQQGGTAIKTQNGQLVYSPRTNVPSEVLYNTLKTNRGEDFPALVLSDGTKVWLNAASSIHFPVSFNGSERKVAITGEAYFEVAKDPSKPFIVKTNNSDIEVLGTHFNIMAYDNEEAVRATLLEGSVRFTGNKKSILLKPGQQGCLLTNGNMELIDHADVNMAVAWKNGVQAFNQADIKTIMRQVERWYDIDVVFKGTLPNRTFSGDIPRTAGLSKVLKLFEISKIHFELDESKKKLTVLP